MVLLSAWLIVFASMCLIWFWYRFSHNPSVVDVGWAMILTMVGLFYLSLNPLTQRSFWLGLILIIWGARLGLYLWYSRIRLHKIDKRYTELGKAWKIAEPLGYFLNFQLQGLFILAISLPWYFTAQSHSTHLTLWEWVVWFAALICIALESVADYQLQQFKQDSPGKVCNIGLWQYSRHPNYFFEWLTWCVFSLFALKQLYGWVGLIGPIVLYWIMNYLTGPLTESGSIQSKGQAYLDYQKKTSMFFPFWGHGEK